MSSCVDLGRITMLFSMIYSNFKESKQREITIHEVQPQIFKLMLDFIYMKDIAVNYWKFAFDLLECSRRFFVDPLERRLTEYLTVR